MNILLKSAKVIDPESAFHLQTKDILINEGVITEIAEHIAPREEKVIENTYVSQGWTDSSVCFGEPGYEERETIAHGLYTAERSGFTHVMINPLTHPVVDNSQGVAFIKEKARGFAATAHPIGALTTGSKGEDLAELYDMQMAGAVAFGDYKKAITNANLVKLALQYTQPFEGVVISFPNTPKIMGKGVVNEHIAGTRLGLKGIPALAEELCVARDLAILEYAGGKLHIPTVSTAKSVALIREAKAKGLDVTCSVAIHHLHFTDEVLEGFDTNFKILPPLREADNLIALREALAEGGIDFVTSDHNPLDVELKFKEFDLAAFGAIGLENTWGVLSQYVNPERAVELLTAARKRFGIGSTPIAQGTTADLTLFTPEGESLFTQEDILSSAKNSPFVGSTMRGKVLGVIANGKATLCI
jgi:dihydroorotase